MTKDDIHIINAVQDGEKELKVSVENGNLYIPVQLDNNWFYMEGTASLTPVV